MGLEIGLQKKARGEAAEALFGFLATTYALYLKTQNFHWNGKGSEFFSLHTLFQKQYEELAEAIDEIAERIRALGSFVEGSFSAFQKHSSLPEAKRGLSSKEMLRELTDGHEQLARMGRPLIPRLQKISDEASADLLIKRLAIHEKAAWILRSHLE